MNEANFSTLPTELQALIFSFSPIGDALLLCSIVCKKWYNYFRHDNEQWFQFALHDFQQRTKQNSANRESLTLMFQELRTRLDWRRYYILERLFFREAEIRFDEKKQLVDLGGINFSAYPPYNGSKPGTRHRHTMSFVQVMHDGAANNVSRRLLVIVGGASHAVNANQHLFNVFDLDTQTFHERQPQLLCHSFPHTFWRHSAAVIGSCVYLFGGSVDPQTKLNTLFKYDLANDTLTQVVYNPTGGEAPCARSDHCACAVGTKMYIFGGSNEKVQPLNDMHVFDTTTLMWSRIDVKTGLLPEPRSGASLVYNETTGYLVLHGGGHWDVNSWKTRYNDTYLFDIVAQKWISPTLASIKPAAGTFTGMVQFEHYVLVMGGGVSATVISGDALLFNVVTGEWRMILKLCNRVCCDGIAMACTDNFETYLYGGFQGVPKDLFMRVQWNWLKNAHDAYLPPPVFQLRE